MDYTANSFNEPIELSLYKIYRQLQIDFGCTYMFLTYEDQRSNSCTVFQTNTDWNKIYIGENFITDCCLIEASKKLLDNRTKKHITFLWNTIKYNNARQKNVIDARKDHGIFHGISYVKQKKSFRKTLGIATEESNHSFIKNIVSYNKLLENILIKADIAVTSKTSY